MIMILAARAVCGLGTAFSVRPAFRQSGGVWVDRLCLRVASRNVQAHRGSAGSVCLFGGIVVPVREARWHGGTGGMAREINRCKPLARLQRQSGALWWSARPWRMALERELEDVRDVVARVTRDHLAVVWRRDD
jgi:hypothetical protein